MPDPAWFDEARFGMFVHWTHIANRGREMSWPMVGGVEVLPHSSDMAVSDYYARALDFCPEPGAAAAWMRMARRAGMRYAVLTTKHHDGFALWPSKHSELSIRQTPYRGDLVAEFVEAARSEGLRIGFYYSLSDWFHPDYPAFREEDKPYLTYLGRRSETWERYLETMFGQIRELLTDYGQVDVMWFDGQWERTVDEWRSKGLAEMIREIQPGILLNDRLAGQGDYATPEQGVPAEVPAGRWETCMTMNRSWGYVPGDREYKSATEIVHTLCEVAGKGGNLLLNVSPRADGSLPPEQVERLEAVANWMDGHGQAIRGAGPGLDPWQFYGPSTRKDDKLFVHCVWRPYEQVVIRGVHIRSVRGVKDLASGRALTFSTRATADQELMNRDPVGEVVVEVPDDVVDPMATVLEVEGA